MAMPSVGGPESHWGVSRYLEFPWLLEAKAETARLMRVFLDEDPREIRAHEGEFLDVMLYMGLVVTEGPCYFKGEDLEVWRRFHTWPELHSLGWFRFLGGVFRWNGAGGVVVVGH